MALTAQALYAQLYDFAVLDWPGEVYFYLEWAARADGEVLEIACYTGQIMLRCLIQIK